MNRVTLRRLGATLGTPLVAAGILLGAMAVGDTAVAGAQPASDSQCAGMSMTNGLDGPNPNALTRAGQVSTVNAPVSDGSMPANCQAAGHS